MSGVGSPPRRAPIADLEQTTTQHPQAEPEKEAAAKSAAAEQAARDKQALVKAIDTARDTVASVRGGLTEIGTQAPTEEELHEAVATTRAEIVAGTHVAGERATQHLRETVGDWGERMEGAAQAFKPLEEQLRSARETLSDAAGTANEALRPQFDRLQTALQSRVDDLAGLRAGFEKVTSEAKSVADPESRVPEPVRIIGEPDRDRSTEDRTADLARHLHEEMIDGSPAKQTNQFQYLFRVTETSIGDLSTKLEQSDPAAVLPAAQDTQTQATQATDGAAHRATRPTPRRASGQSM